MRALLVLQSDPSKVFPAATDLESGATADMLGDAATRFVVRCGGLSTGHHRQQHKCASRRTRAKAAELSRRIRDKAEDASDYLWELASEDIDNGSGSSSACTSARTTMTSVAPNRSCALAPRHILPLTRRRPYHGIRTRRD